MKVRSFTLVSVLLIGCAAAGHLKTPSGRPEITVKANVKDAQKASLGWLMTNGYAVGSQTDLKDVVLYGDRDVTSGWTIGGNDIERVIFNYFAKDSLTTTIYMMKQITEMRTTAGTTISPKHSQKDYEELQAALVEISKNIPSR